METFSDEVNYKLIEKSCRRYPETCAALEILFSIGGLVKNIEKNRNSIFSSNFSSCFCDQLQHITKDYFQSSEFDVETINNIFNEKLRDKPAENSKSQEIFDFILKSIHCCSCEPLRNPKDEFFSGFFHKACECPAHSVCGLDVKESSKCECGKETSYIWDSCNFFINFNFYSFLQQVKKSGIMKDPRLSESNIFKIDSSTRFNFSETMINYLRAVIQKAGEKSCSDTSCMLRSSKVSFSLHKSPEILFIAFKNLQDFDWFNCFVGISSVNHRFDIDELFEDSLGNYELFGIIFETTKENIIYVHRSGQKWMIGGKGKSWNEIFQHAVINHLKISLVIYKKTTASSRFLKSVSKPEIKKEKIQLFNHSSNVNSLRKPEIQGHLARIGYFEGKFEDFESFSPIKIGKKSSYDLRELSEDSEKSNNENNRMKKSKKSEDLNNFQNFNSKKNDYNPFLRKKREKGEEEKSQNPHDLESLEKNPTKKEEENKKQWICQCSTKNSENFDVCINCKKIKPGLNGWACKFCTFRNDMRENRCESCFKFKNQSTSYYFEEKRENWICLLCFSWNNPERNLCSKCNEERQDDD